MGLEREDVGIDVGNTLSVEAAVSWAAENDVRYLDVRPEDELKSDGGLDGEMREEIVETAEDNGVSIGLHTLSAVNTAATTPLVSDGVDEYLKAFVDLATDVRADRVIVHAGCHFTDDEEVRRRASHERLSELADYASENGVRLLLENMNPEPEDAEVHYLCSEIEDCREYFDTHLSETVGWAFNPPHANLQEAGVEGFVDGFDFDTCGEVRLNDNRGVREEHLPIGDGNIDFERMFSKLDEVDYDGPYVIALDALDEMLEERERMVSEY